MAKNIYVLLIENRGGSHQQAQHLEEFLKVHMGPHRKT